MHPFVSSLQALLADIRDLLADAWYILSATLRSAWAWARRSGWLLLRVAAGLAGLGFLAAALLGVLPFFAMAGVLLGGLLPALGYSLTAVPVGWPVLLGGFGLALPVLAAMAVLGASLLCWRYTGRTWHAVVSIIAALGGTLLLGYAGTVLAASYQSYQSIDTSMVLQGATSPLVVDVQRQQMDDRLPQLPLRVSGGVQVVASADDTYSVRITRSSYGANVAEAAAYAQAIDLPVKFENNTVSLKDSFTLQVPHWRLPEVAVTIAVPVGAQVQLPGRSQCGLITMRADGVECVRTPAEEAADAEANARESLQRLQSEAEQAEWKAEQAEAEAGRAAEIAGYARDAADAAEPTLTENARRQEEAAAAAEAARQARANAAAARAAEQSAAEALRQAEEAANQR